MNGKKTGIRYALPLLLSVLAAGCGPSNKGGEEGEGIVFDTVPVFETDSFLYPLSARSSSYLFPEGTFGDIKAIDGDPNTAWHTLPGLVSGEYIEFDFDSLYIGAVEISTAKEMRFSRIKNVKVYAEGKPLGTFPAEMRIPVGKKVNTLRIELGETDGANKIDIPYVADSSRSTQTEALTSESIYSSKSAAVFEVAFFDVKNRRIPVRSLPVKAAKMNFYGVVSPRQMYNGRLLFDGRKGFGWKGPADAEDKTLLFSFNEDQVINGLFFPFTENLNVTKIGFRLRKRPLPEYEVKAAAGGNGIFIPLKNTLKGKNFELVILETRNNEDPFIPELLFHDGSRLFSIYSDSLQFYQKQRVDSSRNTSLAGYLDGRVITTESRKEYAHPLQVIFSKTKTVQDTLPLKAVQDEMMFRLSSNGTFIIRETHNEQTFGDRPGSRRAERMAEGYWILEQGSAEESKITCFAELRESETDNAAGRQSAERTTVRTVNFDVRLLRNYIYFSGYFPAMTTGY